VQNFVLYLIVIQVINEPHWNSSHIYGAMLASCGGYSDSIEVKIEHTAAARFTLVQQVTCRFGLAICSWRLADDLTEDPIKMSQRLKANIVGDLTDP
jgi:hypothetical protein